MTVESLLNFVKGLCSISRILLRKTKLGKERGVDIYNVYLKNGHDVIL
jgi:hypothetical protein